VCNITKQNCTSCSAAICVDAPIIVPVSSALQPVVDVARQHHRYDDMSRFVDVVFHADTRICHLITGAVFAISSSGMEA